MGRGGAWVGHEEAGLKGYFMIFEVKLYEILAINIVVATVLIDWPSLVLGGLLWFSGNIK